MSQKNKLSDNSKTYITVNNMQKFELLYYAVIQAIFFSTSTFLQKRGHFINKYLLYPLIPINKVPFILCWFFNLDDQSWTSQWEETIDCHYKEQKP